SWCRRWQRELSARFLIGESVLPERACGWSLPCLSSGLATTGRAIFVSQLGVATAWVRTAMLTLYHEAPQRYRRPPVPEGHCNFGAMQTECALGPLAYANTGNSQVAAGSSQLTVGSWSCFW